MRIERLAIARFRIPFRQPLVTARGIVRDRAGLLVQLCTDERVTGVGEGCLHPLAPSRLLDDELEHLSALQPILGGVDPRQESFDVHLKRLPAGPARVALECSTLDLRARAAGVRLVELLGGARRERVPVNALIDARDAPAAVEQALDLVQRGFRCLKLKVGSADVAGEARRLSAIRDAVGPEVRLRADFNAALGAAQAIAAIERLQPCGLEYVEQPVADAAALAAVRRAVSVPIAADESVTDADAVDALAAAGAADVIVVKPALLGLAKSRSVIQRALAHGLGVVVTSSLDTSIGIAAALHLTATLPDPMRAAGLATVDLLAGDLARNRLLAHDGHLDLPPGPGLGIEIDEEAVVRWAREYRS